MLPSKRRGIGMGRENDVAMPVIYSDKGAVGGGSLQAEIHNDNGVGIRGGNFPTDIC